MGGGQSKHEKLSFTELQDHCLENATNPPADTPPRLGVCRSPPLWFLCKNLSWVSLVFMVAPRNMSVPRKSQSCFLCLSAPSKNVSCFSPEFLLGVLCYLSISTSSFEIQHLLKAFNRTLTRADVESWNINLTCVFHILCPLSVPFTLARFVIINSSLIACFLVIIY